MLTQLLQRLVLGPADDLRHSDLDKMTRRSPFSSFLNYLAYDHSKEYIDKIFMQLEVFYPDGDFVKTGLDIAATTGYSFYDSLIISAALKARCDTLYTEDLQNGQKIQNLTIVNPFIA